MMATPVGPTSQREPPAVKTKPYGRAELDEMTEDEVALLVKNALDRARQASLQQKSPRSSAPKSPAATSRTANSPRGKKQPASAATSPSSRVRSPKATATSRSGVPKSPRTHLATSSPNKASAMSPPGRSRSATTRNPSPQDFDTPSRKHMDALLSPDESLEHLDSLGSNRSMGSSDDILRRVEEEIAMARKAADDARRRLMNAMTHPVDDDPNSSTELVDILEEHLAEDEDLKGILDVSSAEQEDHDGGHTSDPVVLEKAQISSSKTFLSSKQPTMGSRASPSLTAHIEAMRLSARSEKQRDAKVNAPNGRGLANGAGPVQPIAKEKKGQLAVKEQTAARTAPAEAVAQEQMEAPTNPVSLVAQEQNAAPLQSIPDAAKEQKKTPTNPVPVVAQEQNAAPLQSIPDAAKEQKETPTNPVPVVAQEQNAVPLQSIPDAAKEQKETMTELMSALVKTQTETSTKPVSVVAKMQMEASTEPVPNAAFEQMETPTESVPDAARKQNAEHAEPVPEAALEPTEELSIEMNESVSSEEKDDSWWESDVGDDTEEEPTMEEHDKIVPSDKVETVTETFTWEMDVPADELLPPSPPSPPVLELKKKMTGEGARASFSLPPSPPPMLPPAMKRTAQPNLFQEIVVVSGHGSANMIEERVVTKEVHQLADRKARHIEFRFPYPLPTPMPAPRPGKEIIAEHALGAPEHFSSFREPKPELKELIEATRGESEARRSNACGALKVLSTQKKNQFTLVRAHGFLDALVFVLFQNIPKFDKETALDARSRVVSVILNVSGPKGNRIAVCSQPGLMEGLVKVIAEDQGEARAHACAAVATLAKTVANRELISQVDGLVDLLSNVLQGSIDASRPVFPVAVTKRLFSYDETDEESTARSFLSASSYDSSAPSDEEEEGSSMYSSSGQSRSGADISVANSIRLLQDGKYLEHLKRARSNACAVFLHLSRHSPTMRLLCDSKHFMHCTIQVCSEYENPLHTRCLEIICHLTRFPGNAPKIADNKAVVKTLLKAGKSKILDDRIFALRAFQNITADASSKNMLATSMVLTLLSICAMRKNHDEQSAAVAALYNLSTEAGTVMSLTSTRNVVATLVHLAHNSIVMAEVRQMACDALATIGMWLQTLSAAGKVPTSVTKVLLPSHQPTGWERWD